MSTEPSRQGTSPATDAPFVRPFGALRRRDVPWAGGKGANLGELTAAGLPVPPGFVIGAPAYAAFCDASGLRSALEGVLAGVDLEDTPALDDAAERARRLVLEAYGLEDDRSKATMSLFIDWLMNADDETLDRASAAAESEPRPELELS